MRAHQLALIIHGGPSPQKRALVAHSPKILPKLMFLDLPHYVIRSVARFKL